MRLPPPLHPVWEFALAIAIGLLLLLILSTGARAASVDAFTRGCAGTAIPSTASITVEPGDRLCFEADSDFGAEATREFFIRHPGRASVCLNPDRNSTGGVASVEIDRCDETPGSDALCNHTGLTLSASNACEALTWGPYRFDFTTAAGAGEDARITIRGY